MNKMLVTTFKTEEDAYKGLSILKDLNEKGDITLYATAVLTKDPSGKVEIKQSADKGPVGTAVGLLSGAVIGMLGGPVGSVAGAYAGSTAGLLFNIASAGINTDFLDNVAEVLVPGNTAVLAEVDEDWVTPIDTKMAQFGGMVLRRPRSEVVEDQLNRDSETFRQEMKELREEMKEAEAQSKSTVQKTLTSVESRLKGIIDKADAKLKQIDMETTAKIVTLQAQMKKSNTERKARIENRIAEIKADQKKRSEKLQQAKKLAVEALKP